MAFTAAFASCAVDVSTDGSGHPFHCLADCVFVDGGLAGYVTSGVPLFGLALIDCDGFEHLGSYEATGGLERRSERPVLEVDVGASVEDGEQCGDLEAGEGGVRFEVFDRLYALDAS